MRKKTNLCSVRTGTMLMLSIVILTVLPMTVYAQPQQSIETTNELANVQAFHGTGAYEPVSEILQSEMPLPETSDPQSPGTITISGTMKYKSKSGAWMPMRQTRVVLMDDDVGVDETVATKYTDYNGYFSFTANNDDGFLQGGRDPYVKVYSENGAAYCKTGDLIPSWYVCQLAKCGNDVPDGFTYNYGVLAPTSSNAAWQAIDACLSARDWVYWGSSPNWQRSTKAEVLYPKESWPHSHGNSIHLPYQSTWNWTQSTVHHEYGHCVMWALYGHWPSGSGPDPHHVYDESSLGFAMVEGWAEFMEAAVENKVSNLAGWLNGHGGNIETNDWYNCRDTGTMDGQVIEGEIASILWDINDGTSTADKDSLSMGFNEIFTVMRYDQPDTINQFWTDWTTRWPTLSTSKGPLCTIYWHYGIDKDVYAPSGTIRINAGATYTKTRSVTLSLTGIDWGSGMKDMRFRNSVTAAWSSWYAYATSKSWTLSSGDGTKYVYVQFRDNKGSISTTYVDTIILDTTLPTVTNVTVFPTAFSPRLLGAHTHINFTLSETCIVTIRITNSSGYVVRTLVTNVRYTAGFHSITWNGKYDSGLPASYGTYYIRIYVEDIAGNLASPYPIVRPVSLTK